MLHRDIKPENFLLGRGSQDDTIFLIDFGLASMYRDRTTGLHTPFRTHRSMVGTVRYASLNTHLGIEQGRRDDLESIGYLLVYLLKGALPWQAVRAYCKKDKCDKIMEKKMHTAAETLCSGTFSTRALMV